MAASRSFASSASEWSLAFSRLAASIAARSAEVVVVGVGAAATLCREQALLSAAIDNREIERIVLLRMSPFTVKIRLQDDRNLRMATPRLNILFTPPIGALNSCRRYRHDNDS